MGTPQHTPLPGFIFKLEEVKRFPFILAARQLVGIR